MNGEDTITVSICRTVRPGREEAFERALHDFVQRTLPLPGQMGVHIMRPVPGSDSREYGIVRKFANRDALEAFHRSPEYREWRDAVADLTEGEAHTEELTGLESWFTLPGAPLRPLPKPKLFVATFLGVYPTSLVLIKTVGAWTRSSPWLVSAFVFDAVMVALLTWLVMPAITRVLHPWLHAKESKKLP